MNYTSQSALTRLSSSRMRKPLERRQGKQDLPGGLACFLLGRLDKKKKKKKCRENLRERSQMFPDVTENSHMVEAFLGGNLSQVCALCD